MATSLGFALHELARTVTVVPTETEACPCVEDGRYNAEWHRQNPLEPDCHGQGVIETAGTPTTVYAVWQHANVASGVEPDKMLFQFQAGILKDGDLVCYAAADEDGNEIDWESFTGYIEIGDVKYRVAEVVTGYNSQVAIWRPDARTS